MYETLSSFAQTWGLLMFMALFGGVLVYALWPRNQRKFDEAARTPLRDDEEPLAAQAGHNGGNKDKTDG